MIKFLGSVDLTCCSQLFVSQKYNVEMPMPSFLFPVLTCNYVAYSWLNICRFNSARCWLQCPKHNQHNHHQTASLQQSRWLFYVQIKEIFNHTEEQSRKWWLISYGRLPQQVPIWLSTMPCFRNSIRHAICLYYNVSFYQYCLMVASVMTTTRSPVKYKKFWF